MSCDKCKWENDDCIQKFISEENGMEFSFPCDESCCKGVKWSFKKFFDSKNVPNDQLPFSWVSIFTVLLILVIVSTLSILI